MTTLNELKEAIASTKWFSRIGQPDFAGKAEFIQLPDLEEWKPLTGMRPNEPVPRLFDEGMERLPTSRDEDDPIHGKSLKERSKEIGKYEEFSKVAMGMCKQAIETMRVFQGHPLLRVGPHDFAEGARGAALYAVRRAAYELLLGEPDFLVPGN